MFGTGISGSVYWLAYGMRGQGTGVQIPAVIKMFHSSTVSHALSYSVESSRLFSQGKSGRNVKLTINLRLPVVRMIATIPTLPDVFVAWCLIKLINFYFYSKMSHRSLQKVSSWLETQMSLKRTFPQNSFRYCEFLRNKRESNICLRVVYCQHLCKNMYVFPWRSMREPFVIRKAAFIKHL
jgi:hypothetical protein